MRKRVDFPAPLPPMMPTTAPGGTLKLTLSSSMRSSKDLVSPEASTTMLPRRGPIWGRASGRGEARKEGDVSRDVSRLGEQTAGQGVCGVGEGGRRTGSGTGGEGGKGREGGSQRKGGKEGVKERGIGPPGVILRDPWRDDWHAPLCRAVTASTRVTRNANG
eukprot:360357-Chlamydomonas_euryale.AAC.5